MNNSKNVPFYLFEKNSINELKKILDYKRNAESKYVVFFIDQFFKDSKVFQNLPISNNDLFFFVETIEEPSTNSVNNYYKKILKFALPAIAGPSTQLVVSLVCAAIVGRLTEATYALAAMGIGVLATCGR